MFRVVTARVVAVVQYALSVGDFPLHVLEDNAVDRFIPPTNLDLRVGLVGGKPYFPTLTDNNSAALNPFNRGQSVLTFHNAPEGGYLFAIVYIPSAFCSKRQSSSPLGWGGHDVDHVP